MEKHNGKIAIAIVAMFVVALSIVGFTYAYFVASVEGNETTNVTVTAGILEVEYTTDEGSTLVATNIVPGWKNDSNRFYSAVGYNVVGEEKQYAACVVTPEDGYTAPEGCANATEAEKATVKAPLTFNVSASTRNTGTAYYAIILNSVVNSLGDPDNFTYELLADGDVVGTGTFTNGTPEVMVSEVQSITTGTKEYTINLSYANLTNQEQLSQGKTVSGTVEVVGVVKDGNNNWVDANGVIIIPAPANQG